jgi:hypothetical protein
MIKVLWFLRRAEHLSLDEFRDWWLNRHAPMILDAQRPHLMKYVVNVRWEEDFLPGKPTGELDWDGCAEQWFASESDFLAVYGKTAPSATRADLLQHVSRHARLVVREHQFDVRV